MRNAGSSTADGNPRPAGPYRIAAPEDCLIITDVCVVLHSCHTALWRRAGSPLERRLRDNLKFMGPRLSSFALFGSSVLSTAGAFAEPAATANPVATPEVRRDPHGIKGISPFTEALKRGDSALLARDFDGAVVAYRAAIAKDPQNALGHYRVGEVQILKGDLHEAQEAFTAGLRFVGATNPALKAKLEFALADLRERQKAYDEASVEWTEYEALTTAQKDALGFPASAIERKKVLETWKRLSADALEVKARIEKGLQAADEAVKKSSK